MYGQDRGCFNKYISRNGVGMIYGVSLSAVFVRGSLIDDTRASHLLNEFVSFAKHVMVFVFCNNSCSNIFFTVLNGCRYR